MMRPCTWNQSQNKIQSKTIIDVCHVHKLLMAQIGAFAWWRNSTNQNGQKLHTSDFKCKYDLLIAYRLPNVPLSTLYIIASERLLKFKK